MNVTRSRPLIVSDCDEVLLHMAVHFRDWLHEETDIEFRMEGADFATALRRPATGETLDKLEIWSYLGRFFETEMHRQLPVAGAIEGINALAEHADVVILTNLTDSFQERRRLQLADHGMHARVFTNQGPKGPALRRIVDEFAPTKAIFIDDLAQHHRSARHFYKSPDVDDTPAAGPLQSCTRTDDRPDMF